MQKKIEVSFEQFNDEINSIHEYLMKNKVPTHEIESLFRPILQQTFASKKQYLTWALTVLIAVVLLFVNFETICWYSLAYCRIIFIKLLPLYDWTQVKDEECVLRKWWIPIRIVENVSYNCDVCENLDKIDVYDSISETNLKELYFDIDTPIIIRENSQAWPNYDNLTKELLQNEDISSSIPCSLSSNMNSKRSTVGKLLRKTSYFNSFFLHFQNCDYEAMKHFRNLTPRPSFLPGSVSPVQYNWLVWSKNYNFATPKAIRLVESQDVIVIGQIVGKYLFNLVPKDNCKDVCPILAIVLQENEFLLFTNFWNLEYKAIDEDENVAVILESHSIF